MAEKPRHCLLYIGCYVTVYLSMCIIFLSINHQYTYLINISINHHQLKTHHFGTNHTLPPLNLQYPTLFDANYTLPPVNLQYPPVFATNHSLPSKEQYGQFKEFLSLWPSNRPKAAIYFLIAKERPSLLRKALKSVDKYFNDRFHYPVIIFHEPNARNDLFNITSWSTSYIVYQEITFKLPPFIPVNYKFKNCTYRSRGYRHMCRFHSKLVYEQPIIRLLHYAWRLDDDSKLLSQIEVDVFQFMQRNSIEYGYQVIVEEDARCVDGLWDAARHYVTDNNITTQFFQQMEGRVFYNNFELSKVSFWLSKEYQDYMEYIDQLGGIYYKRWGDAPIKSIALSLFMPRQNIHNFTSISYNHLWYWNPWKGSQADPWVVLNFFENL